MRGDFIRKRVAQRLGVYRCFLKTSVKMSYKTEHKETQQKQKIIKSPSKIFPFKRHADPTARELLWFRENRVWNKGASGIVFFQHFGATWSILVPFLTPSDFEGGPNRPFLKKNNKKWENKKRRSKKRLWKNMICWSIFDAKMRGLKW